MNLPALNRSIIHAFLIYYFYFRALNSLAFLFIRLSDDLLKPIFAVVIILVLSPFSIISYSIFTLHSLLIPVVK
mgnify:CR=1 FL=1